MPNFFARLWLAIVCWFRIVFNPAFAARVQALEAPAALPPREQAPALPGPETKHAAALHLLALLQREGRFVDFCEEDLAAYPDAQIGAAARSVHAGCRKALREALELAPVRAESEGAPVEIAGGFDPAEIRLTGNVTGAPPFKGVLRHHGWKVTRLRMTGAQETRVLAPAEVELP